ncbi:MAG: oxygenase MpaB family protein [Rhodospirillales bacterium]|nr:oxygenase MpaB family protein [Rhodospirillales bacterium]
MKTAPSAYTGTYARARRHARTLADNYIRHTTIGDPQLDPVMEELSSMPPADLHRFIEAGIERQDDVLRKAPRSLRNFFTDLKEPEWLDYESFRPGIRAFHTNADLMLVAFVAGVLVEGFSTLIAKSFNLTGRVAHTSRRLQQNNRQLMEIFYPGGLERDGDGWKLSTRVRFVHCRIRTLLAQSEVWDREAWGTPISAAHLGLAIAVFSKRLLDYSKKVGAAYRRDEETSVLAVWRYAGYLMGIPEPILYRDAEEAESIYTVGFLCEPPPSRDSVEMANALIRSIPGVADITDPIEKRKTTALAYKLSRALIGKTRANQFQYPWNFTFGALLLFRIKQRIQRALRNTQLVRSGNFTQMLQISVYDEGGLSYRMPDSVRASQSSEW